MKKGKMILIALLVIFATAFGHQTITQAAQASTTVSVTDSIQRYENEFKKLERFNIDETQKLAMILAAEYMDIQQRIDLDALCELSPQIATDISNNRQAIFEYFLLTDNFELYEVDGARLDGNTLNFNAVYTFTIADIYGTSRSLLYTKFIYQYADGQWHLIASGEDADPSISGKPNRDANLYGKQDKTKEQFGVDNLMDLFEFSKVNYREKYLNQ